MATSVPQPPLLEALELSRCNQTKKLDRIGDNFLKLSRIELYNYPILFGHKRNLNLYGSAVTIDAGDLATHASGSSENRTAEKQLLMFKTALKINVNKEIRAFTELGLKGCGGDESTMFSMVVEQLPTFKSSRKMLEFHISRSETKGNNVVKKGARQT
ncbi:hypothetical protein YC2023_006615 [Brassica napus]